MTTTIATMRAVAYIRVSTDEQADRYGPDVQRHDIQRYATRAGVEIVGEYIDPGVSGSAPLEDRPALQQALAAYHASQADAIIVQEPGRLGRRLRIALNITDEIEAAGCQLLVAQGRNATHDADEDERDSIETQRAMEYLFADHDRRQILRKLRKARTLKAETGGFAHGRIPYGYNSSRTRGEDGKIAARLLVDPHTSPVVDRIYRLSARGATPGEIARHLSSTPTPRGAGAWSAQAIRKILTNPVYAGELNEVRNAHPAIVSKRLWNQANTELDKRKKK